MGRGRIFPYCGKRSEFSATFSRYGARDGNPGEHALWRQTALLIDILDARGERVSDHGWIAAAPFVGVGVQAGDTVRFSACVRRMVNGYTPEQFHLRIESDFKMDSPKNVRIVKRVGEE